MKAIVRLVPVLLLCINVITSSAQISYGGSPYSFKRSNISMALPSIQLEELDNEELRKAGEENEKNGAPMQVGVLHDVLFNPDNSGWLDNLSNGGRLWRIALNSPGAYAMDLHFSKFNIPEGAELFVYTPERDFIIGKFTSANRNEDGTFYTQDVPGEKIIVEYYEPAGVAFKGELEIDKVGHSYINMFGSDFIEKGPWGNPAGSCQINTKCPEGDGWEAQIASVVCMRFDYRNDKNELKQGLCTGTLINNTKNDKTPYVLSANHCYEAGTILTWVFGFKYETPTCEGGEINNIQTVTGAILRARDNSDESSDFLLLEITGKLSDEVTNNLFFAGWDIRDTRPSIGVGIHHPRGDYKKVSLPRQINNYKNGRFWDVYWHTGAFNKGVVEGGSSGSGLFNFNKRLVGSLYGGNSSCSNTSGNDQYGKLSYGWTNNNNSDNAKKLQPWLDPDNTGVETLDGIYYKPPTSIITVQDRISNLEVFPNPSNGAVTITGNFKNTSLQCSVYNLLGELVVQENIQSSGNNTLQLHHLKNGVYFLKVVDGERFSTVKLVISK